MERVLKYFKSGTEAKMNAVCGLIILTSMITYKVYEFKCPCIPGFNKPYSLMVLLVPPFIFFFVGVIVSQYCTMLTLEYSRPEGNREKNKKLLRQMFTAMIARALAAPVLWILVCLLDGKTLVCAFSETMDPEQFGGFADLVEYDTAFLLAIVPCKSFGLLHTSSTRKAISRFLKFLSQAIGYITILVFIVLAAVARFVGPMLNPAASLQLRYWSRYTDMEEKCFEEMCIEHNHKVAERNIKGYFEKGNDREERYEAYTELAEAPVETLIYVDKWYHSRPSILGAEPPDHHYE
ncbi:calcium homeostasis modulator protein 3-like [Rana temporaria]|uniref:calcium homeostasis modulator protein 3-like n=1 Tax=Rana temporaria TaxID=8407 RepID=UPI001AAC6056|nr:calcium homeostasis modulator protein 3-like [Rana temporaria]